MANIITSIRIVCALAMTVCPTFSKRFYLFYILGGLSDVFDGIAARHWGKETKLGAKLDTIADIVFFAVVWAKTLREVHLPLWLMLWIVCIAVIKCVNILIGVILYKRFLAEHTVMNKLCGFLLFALPFCIGLFSPKTAYILMIPACIAATFAAIQEGYYIRRGKEIS